VSDRGAARREGTQRPAVIALRTDLAELHAGALKARQLKGLGSDIPYRGRFASTLWQFLPEYFYDPGLVLYSPNANIRQQMPCIP
jgi:hypothetical protein